MSLSPGSKPVFSKGVCTLLPVARIHNTTVIPDEGRKYVILHPGIREFCSIFVFHASVDIVSEDPNVFILCTHPFSFTATTAGAK